MRPPRVRPPLFLAVVILLLALPALAQEHPNHARGFKADRAFEVGAIDSVNLFNGNLTLTLPLGSRYPLSSGLSYGFTLVYNSNLWKYEERDNFLPPDTTVPATEAIPDPVFNANLGWMLHFGRLFAPNDTLFNDSSSWVYLSPDGSRHTFYPTLHEGEAVSAGVFYTRDNTYLRLKTATRTIEFPDGTTHHFHSNSFLDEIRDRYSDALGGPINWMRVAMSGTQWVVTDSVGRRHEVNFGGHFIGGTRQIANLKLQTFGGAISTYTLTPEVATIDRTCKDTWWANNRPAVAGGEDKISVPFLKVLFGPEGQTFRMEEPQGQGTVADYHRGEPPTPGSTACFYAGIIESVRLPTQGKLSWTYQEWQFPRFSVEPGNYRSTAVGVATRTVDDPFGPDGTWTYQSQIFPNPGTVTNPAREVRTTVTDPLGNAVKSYFAAPQSQSVSGWKGWEYGLPFSWDSASGDGYLSSETFNAGGTKVRSQWVRYTRDQLGTSGPANDPGGWYDSNRRMDFERTHFHDDGAKVLDTSYAEFDGLGHFRKTTRVSNFDPNVDDTKITRAQYNGTTCYEINVPGNSQTCTGGSAFTPPAVASPWVLHLFNHRQQNQSGSLARQYTVFEPGTGFLQCERTVKSGTVRTADDLLVVYERDVAGNVTAESFYGGDLQVLSTAAGCPAPAAWWYRREHTYSHGVRASTRYRRSQVAGDFLPFYSYRATIDRWTGLPSQSFDTANYPTNLSYDALGRLTVSEPPTSGVPAAERGARTLYTYTAAGGSEARVKIQRLCPTGVSCPTAPFGESELFFDGFGRLVRESLKLADGSTSERRTGYNVMGWKTFASELVPSSTPEALAPSTQYQAFDAFGRPAIVRLPDSTLDANHRIDLSYNGVRVVSRTSRVATTTTGETTSSTGEVYDGQGRLVKVTEPAGAAGATVTTTYQYDVGDRLSRVRQDNGLAGGANVVQERTFVYDNRGFLLSETHPEKGGPVTYGGYDARGHATTKTDGSSVLDLHFSFDKAERLTQVREDNASGRLLKAFSYDTAPGRGLGKLATAERYNHFGAPFNTYGKIVESYSYSGTEGRVSQRDTVLNQGGVDSELFAQSFVFDPAGNLISQTYPTCPDGACLGAVAPQRTITATYSHGHLVAVPGYTGTVSGQAAGVGLTYHGNGTVAAVAHANGVTTSYGLDPSWQARPSSISTSGVILGQNFVSGTYAFDGSGNVKAIGAERFVYDKVSRLIEGSVRLPSWAGGTVQTQGYSFDEFGNLTAVTGTNARSTPTSKHTNRLSNASASYDAAGNLTSYSGTTYLYDRLNVLQRMTTAAGPAQQDWIYLYTADDERAWAVQVNGSAATFTLRDLAGRPVRQIGDAASANNVKDYIYRGGALLATIQPTTAVRHYHLDHLGTPRLITDALKNALAHHTYFPFGEEAPGSSPDTEPMKFTGHERDLNHTGGAGDDLDYMHARFCSPVTGRFLSVDPEKRYQPTKMVQLWNRYAYAAGNPMKYIDPDGRDIDVPDWLSSVVSAGLARSSRFASIFTRLDFDSKVHVSFKQTARPSTGSTISSEISVSRDATGRILGVKMVSTVPLNARTAAKIGHELYHVIEVLTTNETLRKRFEAGEPGIRRNATGYESDAALEVESTIRIEMSPPPLSATGQRDALAAGFGVTIYVDGVLIPGMGPRY